jgi:hypothetical protein
MKTLLFVTTQPRHWILYRKRLREHFALEFAVEAEGATGTADAVVYDMPRRHLQCDVDWLKQASVPVVVLTPEDSIGVPETPSRRILTYPVRADEILDALAELGVSQGGRSPEGK